MASIRTSRLLFLSSFGLLLVLSGCQTITPAWFHWKHKHAEAPQPAVSSIAAHEFQISPGQDMVGAIATVRTGEADTLPDIARHFGLGYNDIVNANRAIPPWTPKANSRVILPLQFILPDAPRKGIVLNLANMRMFYYPRREPGKVYTYPVGIGRDGWNTPMGTTSIASKTPNPVWHVPPSIQQEHAARGHILPSAVRSGPDNPLGDYAMRLAIGSYLIHGTNKPYGIGMQISHGCVQMYPENIEVLFNKTSVGTPVQIIHQPYLTAWQDDMLYLEANEPIGKWAINAAKLKKQVIRELRKLSKQRRVSVDWAKVDRILERSDGISTPVLVNSPDIPELAQQSVAVAHPGTLYGQPEVQTLTDNDWAMLVATFSNETEAQEFAAMLNHQGPPIPARKVKTDNAYQVIAGPFKTQKEAKAAASRIRFDFEIEAKLLKPLKSRELARL